VLLDKTAALSPWAIASDRFRAVDGYPQLKLALAAALASSADETRDKASSPPALAFPGRRAGLKASYRNIIAFSAQTRQTASMLSDGRLFRKGRPTRSSALSSKEAARFLPACRDCRRDRFKSATPLVVAENSKIAGVCALRFLKSGSRAFRAGCARWACAPL